MEDPRYVLLERVGTGSFGEVFKGLHKASNALVAIKRLKKHDTDPLTLREVRALRALPPHPHIITLHDVCRNKEDGAFFLVFDYVGGGDGT